MASDRKRQHKNSHHTPKIDTPEQPTLSVIIPAYNEERRLPDYLKEVVGTLEKDNEIFEVLIVDDGSHDRTSEIARAFSSPSVRLLKNETNCGKGAAVKRGMLAAQGKFRLFADADGAAPFREYKKLLSSLKQADIAIGSRAKRGAVIQKHQTFQRELLGKGFNLFVQMLFLPGIWDTQCGFKAFREEAARALFSQASISGFAFDVEVLYLARKEKLSICEIPIQWEDQLGSTVRPLTHGTEMLKDLLRLRFLPFLARS